MNKSFHPIQLIVGLGNPGDEYRNTRHNLGIRFVEDLLADIPITFTHEKKFHGDICKVHMFNHDFRVLIPTTFMNLSGQSVRAVAKFFQIPVHEILVVHDDLDLPAGTVRLKKDGGHGGHNGLRDIIQQLGSAEFLRLRIGIGHPKREHAVVNHVLGRMNKHEQTLIDDAISNALRVMPDVLAGDIEKAMQQLHS